MATRPSTIEFILEQAAGVGGLSAKRMFGAYGLYCGGKLVALVCDDQLFAKPTTAGRAYLGDVTEAPPYPGAKPYLLISGETWEDADRLATLFAVTAAALPAPAPKRPSGRGRRPAGGTRGP